MKFNEIKIGFEITPLILTTPEKDYFYTCTLDNASNLENDYIFIPLASQLNESVIDLLGRAMQNPHCKGFVLNHSALAQEQFRPLFHLLMKKYCLKTEVIFLVKNVYNFACHLAALNQQKYNTKIITIAGTHETSIVRDALVRQLQGNHSNILYNINYWSCWQKIIENILLAQENTDYAIIEAIPEKKGLMSIVAKYKNNNIIFSNSEIFKTSIYSDLYDLREELNAILQYPKNITSIICSDDNEIADSSINYTLQDKLHIIKEHMSDINFKALEKANSLSAEFMKSAGLSYNNRVFLNRKSLYSTYEKNSISYFVMNSSVNPTIDTIKSCMDSFFEKNKSDKKIVIFDCIEDLGPYKHHIYNEIFKHLAQLKPNILFLLNIEKYTHLYKKYEKNTYIKTAKFSSKDLYSVNEFRIILGKWLEDNTAVFVYSKQEVV